MSDITANMVKELRERTGAGMMECKKALVAAAGDLEKAIEAMRKSGQAKALKKAGRIAAEGVVVVASSKNNKMSAIAEINCETDFVAMDGNFNHFANQVINAILTHADPHINQETLANLNIDGKTLEEVRQGAIAKLGENVQVRRAVLLQSNHPIVHYLHGKRIGVLVALSVDNSELGKDIAMHIAATHPEAIRPEDIPAALVEKEKEIFTEQARASGKSDEIIEKMIGGRIKKFLNENSLLGQAFVKNPEQTIAQLLNQHQAKVEAFVRYEVGEGIEKETTDFAAEVMAQVRGDA